MKAPLLLVHKMTLIMELLIADLHLVADDGVADGCLWLERWDRLGSTTTL